MGVYVSTTAGVEVTRRAKLMHKEAEKQLKEAKAKMATQVKVLLLGGGDSGKSTVRKDAQQIRLIHNVPFSPDEIELYRQIIFENLTRGIKYILDAMKPMQLQVLEDNRPFAEFLEDTKDLKDGEAFPRELYTPLKQLWEDPHVQNAYSRGNEAALPENLSYFYSNLERLFQEDYQPTHQDILHCRARTIGIDETSVKIQGQEMIIVDVGGQKSERRKWIHCFQDIRTVLFLVNLNGFDQCLAEDNSVNQMQDSLTIWDSICNSQWFKKTSFILFLNKDDLFQSKVLTSDIKNVFPVSRYAVAFIARFDSQLNLKDYEGPAKDAKAGREYFKRRFGKIASKAGRSNDRQIYIQ